jgi:hypothetical protein
VTERDRPGYKYVRRVSPGDYRPATWFDVRDAYEAGRREALEWAAVWLETRQPGPDGLLDTVDLIEALRREAECLP